MALAYTPPGVSVLELTSPTASPLLSVPTQIGLVGLSQGFVQASEVITLTGVAVTPLTTVPAGASVTAIAPVTNANAPITYTLTTDYTLSGFPTTSPTVTRVGGGTIPSGAQVKVVYNYIPTDYWDPIRLDSFGSVQSRFGPAYDAAGNISTHLTAAAALAFENGADQIVCHPLSVRATPGDPTTVRSQPNATQQAASTTWSDTLYVLRDIDDVNVLVPVVGQSMANVDDAAWVAIAGVVQDHVKFMKDQNQYMVALLAEDSSAAATVGQMATLRAHAASLQARQGGVVNEATVLISPSKYSRVNSLGTTIFVGGQYVAAAIAGMLAARGIAQTTTRKQVSGLKAVNDYRSKADKNADGAAGLLVVEQKGLGVVVRHAVTLDNTSTAKRELSVVRQKHFMIESIRQTLENQIIGQVVADGNSNAVVSATITAVLEALKANQDIVGYNGVESRTLTLDPTVVEVRFNYRPAFPINYINVTFSLDLSAGDITANANIAAGNTF